MPYLAWLWDKIAGNFLWWVILLVGGFVLTRMRRLLTRVWQWVVGFLRKKATTAALSTTIIAPKAQMLDSVGVWFLVLALVLLALWNQKLQHDTHLLHVEMVRYVLPRELTQDQINAFGKYLASHTQPQEVTIKYISGDPESQHYAESFAAAFGAGNWLPNMTSVNPINVTCHPTPSGSASPIACDGELNDFVRSKIVQSGPNPPQLTVEQKLRPWLYRSVCDAVKVGSILGVDCGYEGNNTDSLNTIVVVIGHRPRDKHAVLPPNLDWNALKRDINDDDF